MQLAFRNAKHAESPGLTPQHHTVCVMPVKPLISAPRGWKWEGVSEGYPVLHSKLEVSLGYVSPHLKK